MAWQCRCGARIPIDVTFPARCSCGCTDYGDRVECRPPAIDRDYPINLAGGSSQAPSLVDIAPTSPPCIYRGEAIGTWDCGCAGESAVYQCPKHGNCAPHKLKSGSSFLVTIDGTTAQQKLTFCAVCEDYTASISQ